MSWRAGAQPLWPERQDSGWTPRSRKELESDFRLARLFPLCVAGPQPFTGKARLRPGCVDFASSETDGPGAAFSSYPEGRVSKVEWLER
jgi:hypothetical protein